MSDSKKKAKAFRLENQECALRQDIITHKSFVVFFSDAGEYFMYHITCVII